jgi:hypothetical protein
MSTTHKATPYARDFDTTQAHELGFYFTDYPLSYSLGLEIAEALGERLTDANDPSSSEYDSSDFSDILHETLDAVFPVYHNEILKEWQDAGCPESDEYDFGKGIWSQMTAGLYEAMSNFAWGVAGNADTLAEALDRLNTLYPYKTD